MLVSLHVNNLALIDETEVYFNEGLNILSGETGAGKSIIIGSINLALGARADKGFIRNGAEYALIELVFQIDNDAQERAIKELDIPIEDGMILLQRKIMENRSVCKVCGETVTSKQLKGLAAVLIDIHGQHEHQSLMNVKKHLEFLDDFGKEELSFVKKEISTEYSNYMDCIKKLQEVSAEASVRDREVSLIQFEIKEIEDAKLQVGEDDLLEASYQKMINSKKIKEGVYEVYGYTGYEQGAGELLGRAVRELKLISGYDTVIAELEGQAEEIDNLLNDFNRSISNYLTDLEFDEEEFITTQERLNQINHLKTKYAATIPAILACQSEKQENLDMLLHAEEYIKNLEMQKVEIEKKLNILCEKASIIRKEKAKILEQAMEQALLDLNFNAVQFSVALTKKEHFSPDGTDEAEFMISLNAGEPLRSLIQVASGGELSRIMLALKTLMAKKDDIHTLIFDEIDAGISGKTAWKVSEKLAILGKEHQIICITHLPQIAAMADYHYVIIKKTEQNSTTTSIEEIKEEQMLFELARMLGSDSITENALSNAKELKEMARKTKLY